MPRQARIIEKDVCFHIISRGNQKRDVFCGDLDCKCFLSILKKYKWHYSFKLYAYCIMPNHFHLLLEIEPVEDLSELMKRVNQTYSIYFNSKYSTCGHVWQGRYKSMIIARDDYLIDCIRYIEFNPIRAGMIARPEDYKWSSYKDRISGVHNGILNHLLKI